MGIDLPERINSTRLKEKLLQLCSDIFSYSEGRNVIFAQKEDVANSLRFTCTTAEKINLIQTAKIMRRDMFNLKQNFDGSFNKWSETNSVPQSLLLLLNVVLGMSKGEVNNSAVSVSQIILFNHYKHQRKTNAGSSRHNTDKETPLPIYIGLLIHAHTRSRTLIDIFHDMGLSISYNRVLDISTTLGNNLIEQFDCDGVVCPKDLKKNVFTIAATVNIDHNPTSRTATDSFHGTVISITQHKNFENDGMARELKPIDFTNSSRKSLLKDLPPSYTTFQPLTLPLKDLYVPINKE